MPTKSLVFAGVALVVGAVATLPASAAPTLKPADGPMGPTIMFNLLDRNGDGVIDKDEASALTTAVFAALDTDHSGTLTEQELRGALKHFGMNRAMGKRQAQGEFQRGRDGHDRHEGFGPRMAERGPMMRHYGQMGPGPNMEAGLGRTDPGPGPGMGQGPGPNMEQGAGPNMGQGPGSNMAQGPGPNDGQAGDQTNDPRARMFAYLDTNHDGVISKEEFDAARFPRMGFERGR